METNTMKAILHNRYGSPKHMYLGEVPKPYYVSVKKDTMDSHFSKLRDSLIEICVMVGMDQDTGLVQTS